MSKLLKLFHTVHGVYDNNFSVEIIEDDEFNEVAVQVTKSEKGPCGYYTREELMLDWIDSLLPPDLPPPDLNNEADEDKCLAI